MIFNSKGLTPSSIEDNLLKWTQIFRGDNEGKYGSDFVITKESVIGNLCTASSLNTMDIEECLLFVAKNINPYTAEGEWLDALYKLIGLQRRYAEYTVVQRTVEGEANTTIPKGAILFRNKTTNDQFRLNDDCQINENGKGIGSFTAEELGAIDLANEVLCEIITAPASVSGIYYSEGNQIKLGQEYEDDAEYRIRWQEYQSLANSNTTGGLKTKLSGLVETSKDIKVRMNRGTTAYDDLPLHTMNIVINSAYDDETIAQKIFEFTEDGGADLAGKIEVNLKDSEKNDVKIKFSRANKIKINYHVVLSLKNDIQLSQVLASVKNAVRNSFDYHMGEDVVANKAISSIDKVEGVEYVKSIKVSKSDSLSWSDVVEIADIELAQIGDTNVSE